MTEDPSSIEMGVLDPSHIAPATTNIRDQNDKETRSFQIAELECKDANGDSHQGLRSALRLLTLAAPQERLGAPRH